MKTRSYIRACTADLNVKSEYSFIEQGHSIGRPHQSRGQVNKPNPQNLDCSLRLGIQHQLAPLHIHIHTCTSVTLSTRLTLTFTETSFPSRPAHRPPSSCLSLRFHRPEARGHDLTQALENESRLTSIPLPSHDAASPASIPITIPAVARVLASWQSAQRSAGNEPQPTATNRSQPEQQQ